MANLVILHEDALSLNHPIFSDETKSLSTRSAWKQPVFIWDSNYFSDAGYSFKRLVFIYETLSTLPVDIYYGKMNEVIVHLIQEQSVTDIFIPETPNPQLCAFIDFAHNLVATHVINEKAFVSLDRTPDLGRFFRYWNKAKKAALSPDGVRL
ncbi:MAG: hypothetical protein HOH48_08005 [Candidatus Puniceispirillum sp.]|jgi:hypothetical protein|uniref:hypothetical protein n=1 Tax=Candidatus Puniceispirillum sp. TaxID=2026719 RepID=UPI001EC41A67|nr:hypothetical protein [Candidatus Puniceispirillum sp.]MBT6415252.1 hypothetical protein [Candidatus Puniceispirillum sp.]MBT6567209.1 hypothetical protein [Candidatus Puniceispirillum sp.]